MMREYRDTSTDGLARVDWIVPAVARVRRHRVRTALLGRLLVPAVLTVLVVLVAVIVAVFRG